jgi:murein DD-endopeptidase MepM/ murein hydrolase activator NlpD
MNIWRSFVKSILALQTTALLAIVPNIANPGFFSFISSSSSTQFLNNNYLQAEVLSTKKPELNSQNMPVLQAAVHVDPNPAKGGGDIVIVDDMALAAESGISGTTLDIEKAEHTGQISVYEVREGDTLSQIADMFDVSVNTIRWANDFEGSIHPGQSLVILPVTGISHTVKFGGSIEDVAELYDADIREIALFNGLDESVELHPGDEIIVPNVDPGHNDSDEHDRSGHSSNSKVYATGATNSVSSSYFINPVPGGLITQGNHGFNGVDISIGYGTPILAAASGKVITSKQGGWNGGYGNYVVISHDNGTQTLYSHNSSNTVYVGQYVEQGEVVGYMGSTGQSTGNHLHFEVRGATNPLNSCGVGSVCR